MSIYKKYIISSPKLACLNIYISTNNSFAKTIDYEKKKDIRVVVEKWMNYLNYYKYKHSYLGSI